PRRAARCIVAPSAARRAGTRLVCLQLGHIMDSYQRTRTGLTILGLLGAAWAATAAAKRRARRIELKGKVVVITGGGRGLGLAIAREFAARGCKLAICGRDGATIAGAVLALRAQGAEIIGASCDTSNAQAAHTF